MEPTLADHDRLVVNKWIYRVGEPRPGDIVMLYYPVDPDKSFVKRVIAREGDEVRITSGRVYVNGVALSDEFVPPEYRSHEDFGPEVVPEGYYFVMGDHRNGSFDSRHWGPVPKKYHRRKDSTALVAAKQCEAVLSGACPRSRERRMSRGPRSLDWSVDWGSLRACNKPNRHSSGTCLRADH